MKVVIVTGGRDYNDYHKVADILEFLNADLIIQGGATGADKMAKTYAELAGIECQTYEADWNAYGKAAGPIRNTLMLKENPNAVVLAFPGGNGTANCLKQAVSMDMTVLLVR